jgi:alpha-galactosidase
LAYIRAATLPCGKLAALLSGFRRLLCPKVRSHQHVKAIRPIVQYGISARLLSPFEGNLCAWQSAYQDEVLLFVFQVLQTPSVLPRRVCLYGLGKGVYEDRQTGRRITGRDLMRYGVEADFRTGGGDFQSKVFHWKKVE